MRISPSGGYITSGTATDLDTFCTTNSSPINTTVTTIYNTQHNVQQVKVGVFKVTRSEETQKVTGTQFLKEMWVEVKPNVDVKLTVASKLTKEDLQGADLSELDIRELTTVTFY